MNLPGEYLKPQIWENDSMHGKVLSAAQRLQRALDEMGTENDRDTLVWAHVSEGKHLSIRVEMWWRRRELNPRPRKLALQRLRA